MAEHSLNKKLAGLPAALGLFGSIRPDERQDAVASFLTLLGFMTGHAILETARDALFLAELSARLLPWVYITLAAITLLLTRYHPNLASRLPRGQELTGWLLFAASTTAVLWIATFWVGDWIYYILYAWTGVIATLVVIQFWTMLGSLFTVTQAKRLFAIIGTGSILGAILGSGLASALSTVLPAQHLVLAAAMFFSIAAFGPRLFEATALRQPEAPRIPQPPPELGQIARLILGRPYLKRIALAILLATITFTLVDFIFKSTVARLVPDESLGTFFSTTYFSLNLLSLVIQVTTVGWLLRHITVSSALSIIPLLLLCCAMGFIASGGLILAIALKSVDGSLRYSLYRTTMELLFVPISAEVRGRVKMFIDLVGQRGGQAAGSILVLAVLSLTTNEIAVGVVAVITAGAWLYTVIKLKPYYLDLFRETLREDLTATRIEFPALDVASLESLIYTLNSSDDRQVIAALDLLANQEKIKVVPGLILYHPSPEILIHAVDLFAEAGRTDALPMIDRLTSHPDPEVRAASLRGRTVLAADPARLWSALEDPSECVRATAAIALVSSGESTLDKIDARLGNMLDGKDPGVMLAIAETVRELPARAFDTVLLDLAKSDVAEVQLATVRAMRAIGDPIFTGALSRLLQYRPLRNEARAALVALGPGALAGLSEELGDSTLPHAIRRHLPQTIAAFGTPQAAAVLLRHLLEEDDGMIRFKVLRALGRMRSMNAALSLDNKTIRQSIEQNLEAAFRYMRWRNSLEQHSGTIAGDWSEYHKLLIDLLHDKQSHTLQRLFRLLNLSAFDEEFLRIYRGLHSRRREARASSRELIEHIIEPEKARQILKLIDDLFEPAAKPETERRSASTSDWEKTLAELFASGIESLSSLAALEIGKLRIAALKPALEAAVPLSASHAELIGTALHQIEMRKEQNDG